MSDCPHCGSATPWGCNCGRVSTSDMLKRKRTAGLIILAHLRKHAGEHLHVSLLSAKIQERVNDPNVTVTPGLYWIEEQGIRIESERGWIRLP